jgi:hypothetical protein
MSCALMSDSSQLLGAEYLFLRLVVSHIHRRFVDSEVSLLYLETSANR